MASITDEIISHYTNYDESKRLSSDVGLVELAHTREIMSRYLPPAPAVVFDIGGATGIYSYWLAGIGYEVNLIDLVPAHIEKAVAHGRRPGTPALKSATVGDARDLKVPGALADVVVLHGPLYHLCDRGHRRKALSEALRILKPGGTLFAFAITRYAGLIYGLTKGFVFDRDYLRMISEEVHTGRRTKPPQWSKTFANAYFHLPSELAQEVEEAGFRVEGPLGIAGPSWMVPELDESWKVAEKREAILAAARLTEHEPALSPRIVAVGEKVE